MVVSYEVFVVCLMMVLMLVLAVEIQVTALDRELDKFRQKTEQAPSDR
jgi:hypothetical protein